MHCNGDDMHIMRRLGWVSLLAATVALGGCDDDGDGSMTGVATMTGTGTGMGEETGDSSEPSTGGEESSGGDIDCSSAPSHDEVIQPIWDASCVTGCHAPGGSWATLDLSPGVAYDQVIEVEGVLSQLQGLDLVTPGDADNSFLLQKLKGTQTGAGAGNEQMPLGANPLADADIALVEQWIACGAEP